MSEPILTFSGPYRFLSNFWDFRPDIITDSFGLEYTSVETAYQASKSSDIAVRKVFQKITPRQAKRISKELEVVGNWHRIKFGVMFDLVSKKFQIPTLRDQLLATGEAELIEGNYWGDVVWGVCNGVGENHLGRILMEVRSNLKIDTVRQG